MSRRLELDRPFGQGLFARIKHAIISRSATRIVVPHCLLPVLFLVLATPTVLIQVYLTPPIQVADEENHFLRATQISEGHLFSRKMEAGSGGLVDGGAVIFAHAFDGLKFRPDLKIAPPVYGVMSRLRWGDQPPEPTNFANTAIYPFFLYLPASVAIGAGRHAGLSIMDSFYLGRLVTAVVSLGLAALALHLCGQGRTTLFLILCFPMTLSLFASVSQDAMSITLGALAAALWSRYVARRAPMPVAARVTVALALGAVIAARLPLLPLYVLAVMPTWPMSPSGRPRLRDVAAALAGLVPLALGVVGIHLAKVPFRTGDNVSASGQSSWIVEHPREALRVATRTLSQDTFRHLHDMVGMLGWLDTELPKAFYTGMAWCVILAAALDVFVFRRAFIPRWGWLPLFGVVTSIAGVFGALYIAWTPVGASVVDGVQGRYFLVPAIVLALCLPGYRIVQDERITNASKVVQSALCVGVALAILWVVPITLIHRYYG